MRAVCVTDVQDLVEPYPHTHCIEVAEFRKPEFKIKSEHRPTTAHFSHETKQESVTAVATAQYFSGGALSGADCHWSVTASRSQFRPPGLTDWAFGKASQGRGVGGGSRFFGGGWWGGFGYGYGYGYGGQSEPEPDFGAPKTFDSKTGSDGSHQLRIAYTVCECPARRWLATGKGLSSIFMHMCL